MKNSVLILMTITLLGSCGKWKESNHIAASEEPFYYAGAFNEKTIAAVGYSGTVAYYNEETKAWKEGSNRTACLFGMEMIDPQTYIACGNAKGVTRTTDSGKTWQTLTPFGGQEPSQCRYASFSSKETGWLASATLLGQTTDGGQNWKEISFPKEIGSLMALCNTGKDSGYIFTVKGGLYYTEDSGDNWELISQVMNPKEQSFRNDLSRNRPTLQFRFNGETGILAYIAETDTGYELKIHTSGDKGFTWKLIQSIPHTMGTVFINPEGNLISTLNLDGSVSLFSN